MKKFLPFAPLFALLLLLNSCTSDHNPRSLIVTQVTHFEVRGDGAALNLPVFAGTMSVDEITRDINLAEYYHDKLKSVYNFNSYSLLGSEVSDTIAAADDLRRHPARIYAWNKPDVSLDLQLVGLENSVAQYRLSVADSTNTIRTHTVEVPSGKSASVGLLFDEAANRGYLLAVSMLSLALDAAPDPARVENFLREKNAMLHRTGADSFLRSDQWIMNTLFDSQAPQLPLADAPDTAGFVEFDTPPQPVGGMRALAASVNYPEAARAAKLEGRVLVKVRIDTSGNIVAHDLLQGVNTELDSAAISAILHTPFTPAQQNGKPIAVWVTIPVQFKLD